MGSTRPNAARGTAGNGGSIPPGSTIPRELFGGFDFPWYK
jgi:hypothetical protein